MKRSSGKILLGTLFLAALLSCRAIESDQTSSSAAVQQLEQGEAEIGLDLAGLAVTKPSALSATTGALSVKKACDSQILALNLDADPEIDYFSISREATKESIKSLNSELLLPLTGASDTTLTVQKCLAKERSSDQKKPCTEGQRFAIDTDTEPTSAVPLKIALTELARMDRRILSECSALIARASTYTENQDYASLFDKQPGKKLIANLSLMTPYQCQDIVTNHYLALAKSHALDHIKENDPSAGSLSLADEAKPPIDKNQAFLIGGGVASLLSIVGLVLSVKYWRHYKKASGIKKAIAELGKETTAQSKRKELRKTLREKLGEELEAVQKEYALAMNYHSLLKKANVTKPSLIEKIKKTHGNFLRLDESGALGNDSVTALRNAGIVVKDKEGKILADITQIVASNKRNGKLSVEDFVNALDIKKHVRLSDSEKNMIKKYEKNGGGKEALEKLVKKYQLDTMHSLANSDKGPDEIERTKHRDSVTHAEALKRKYKGAKGKAIAASLATIFATAGATTLMVMGLEGMKLAGEASSEFFASLDKSYDRLLALYQQRSELRSKIDTCDFP